MPHEKTANLRIQTLPPQNLRVKSRAIPWNFSRLDNRVCRKVLVLRLAYCLRIITKSSLANNVEMLLRQVSPVVRFIFTALLQVITAPDGKYADGTHDAVQPKTSAECLKKVT